jgi:hypothetical protein
MATLGLDAYTPGAPMWWVHRLYDRLTSRRPDINKWDDYYRGDFPLPWLAPQAADEFRRILKMSRCNYTGLVVDAQCERMAIEGFRLSEAKPEQGAPNSPEDDDDGAIADDEMWRIWESNNMDAQFDQGLLEAAITGVSYILVAPNPKDDVTPKMWIEHSSQTIMAFVPGTNRQEVAAALKVFVDEWTGQTFATLYLPNFIWKFKTNGQMQKMPLLPAIDPSLASLEFPLWQLRGDTLETSVDANRFGLVPMWELPNNPRLLSGGQSELYDLTDSMDRIVKTIADRMVTQDYGAFPQKWISGWPLTDEAGKPTPAIEVGRDRIITTEVVETKFGQFAAAAIQGYLDGKREDVKDIASRSRTPAQYLLGEMNNVNGDTLKASESGLVAKVKQRQRGHNPGVQNAAIFTRQLAGLGDPRKRGQRYEAIWRNPEFRTEGELVDALLKMADLGVPEEALWLRWGATPAEVRRWKTMLEDKMKRAAAGDATVILAERFRAAAAPLDDSNANGGGGSRNGGGTNTAGTQPGRPRGTKGPGNRSGGTSSANASAQRPNAPKSSTT